MPIHVLQWLVARSTAALAVGPFIITSGLYCTSATVAIPLVPIVLQTVCGNVVITHPGSEFMQSSMGACVGEAKGIVRQIAQADFNRLYESLAI